MSVSTFNNCKASGVIILQIIGGKVKSFSDRWINRKDRATSFFASSFSIVNGGRSIPGVASSLQCPFSAAGEAFGLPDREGFTSTAAAAAAASSSCAYPQKRPQARQIRRLPERRCFDFLIHKFVSFCSFYLFFVFVFLPDSAVIVISLTSAIRVSSGSIVHKALDFLLSVRFLLFMKGKVDPQ